MAYVAVDQDRTWIAEEGLHHCPQVIHILSSDTPYVQIDFDKVLDEDTTISSVSVTEKDSQTITVADDSVSGTGRKVSFKVSGMSAGTFVMRVAATLSTGTTQVISKQGTLLVS